MGKYKAPKERVELDDVTMAGELVRRFQILLYEADPGKLYEFINDVIAKTSELLEEDIEGPGGVSSDAALEALIPYIHTLSKDPYLPSWLRYRLNRARAFRRTQDRSIRFTLFNIQQYMRANGWIGASGKPSVTPQELERVVTKRKPD